MSEHKVSFQSQGWRIAGVVSNPPDLKAGERRPALIVLHGFGTNKAADNVVKPCAEFNALGDITFRFDMPGWFQQADKNGDKLLDKDEAKAVPEVAKRFQQIDSNGDGGISNAEFMTAMKGQ